MASRQMNTQTIKIHLLQGSSEFVIKMNVNADAETSLIVGTALNELFHWVNLQKRMNVKNGLKLSLPIDMRIEGEQFISIELGNIQTIFKERLKMNSTAKSKKAFALKFVELVNESLRIKEAKHLEEVIQQLDTEIEFLEAVK
jgi:hypothetical protein